MGIFELENTIKKDEQAKQWTKLSQFKQLSTGAGSSIFKTSPEGVFVGGTKFSNAPFRLDYEGSLRLGPTTGSGVGIAGTGGTFDLYFDDTKTGSLSGLQTTVGSETIYVSLSNVVGRSISLGASGIYCGGALYPASDFNDSMGSSTIRWNELWCRSIIAHGTNAKFSINGSDGLADSDLNDSTGTAIARVNGGIITNRYY